MYCGNSYWIVKDDKTHGNRSYIPYQDEFYHQLDDSGLISAQNENWFVLNVKMDYFFH